MDFPYLQYTPSKQAGMVSPQLGYGILGAAGLFHYFILNCQNVAFFFNQAGRKVYSTNYASGFERSSEQAGNQKLGFQRALSLRARAAIDSFSPFCRNREEATANCKNTRRVRKADLGADKGDHV